MVIIPTSYRSCNQHCYLHNNPWKLLQDLVTIPTSSRSCNQPCCLYNDPWQLPQDLVTTQASSRCCNLQVLNNPVPVLPAPSPTPAPSSSMAPSPGTKPPCPCPSLNLPLLRPLDPPRLLHQVLNHPISVHACTCPYLDLLTLSWLPH